MKKQNKKSKQQTQFKSQKTQQSSPQTHLQSIGNSNISSPQTDDTATSLDNHISSGYHQDVQLVVEGGCLPEPTEESAPRVKCLNKFEAQKQNQTQAIEQLTCLNQFMATESLKNRVDQKRRSLSEGMSTKEEEDTDERDEQDESSLEDLLPHHANNKHHKQIQSATKQETQQLQRFETRQTQTDCHGPDQFESLIEQCEQEIQTDRVLQKRKISDQSTQIIVEEQLNYHHENRSNQQSETNAALLMIKGDYKGAWMVLASEQHPTCDTLFLQATCAMKLKNHHKAISILNEIKRNQMNRRLKIKSLLLRMKAFKKLLLYDESLRDGRAAWAMMSPEQTMQNQQLKQEIKELKILSKYYESKNSSSAMRALRAIIKFFGHNKKLLLLVIVSVIAFICRQKITESMTTLLQSLTTFVNKVQ